MAIGFNNPNPPSYKLIVLRVHASHLMDCPYQESWLELVADGVFEGLH